MFSATTRVTDPPGPQQAAQAIRGASSALVGIAPLSGLGDTLELVAKFVGSFQVRCIDSKISPVNDVSYLRMTMSTMLRFDSSAKLSKPLRSESASIEAVGCPRR